MFSKILIRTSLICLVGLCFVSARGQATCYSLEFNIAPTFGAGPDAVGSTLADLNGDGKPDAAVVNLNRQTVSVLDGDGFGGFSPPRTFPTTFNVSTVVAVDLNNDTRLDLVAAGQNQTQMAILINNGTGGFQPAIIYSAPTSGEYVDLKAGDFNGDGNQDIAAIRSQFNRQLHIFLGNGAGALAPTPSMALTGSEAVMEVGNLNLDSFSDIVVSGGDSFSSRHISFVYGGGGGTYSLTFGANVLEKAMGFSIARFNADPSPDFVVAFEDTTTPTQPYLQPWLAGLGGSFTPGTRIEPPYFLSPSDVTTGDYNGDGFQDIAAPLSGHLVIVMYGRGDGQFQEASHWSVQAGARSIVSSDLDSDGKIDLVNFQQASTNNSLISVLANLGNHKFRAPKAVLWGLSQISAADFNGDGLLDFASSRRSDSGFVSSVEVNINSADGLGPDIGVPTPRGLTQMTVGDFNGDGHKDAVSSHTGTDRRIAAYLGNGTGTLSASVATSLSVSFENVIAGKFNGDSFDDVFVVDSSSRGYSMLSNGDGTFTTAPNFPVTLQGSIVKLQKGDFNEDGKLDLIVSNGTVHLWLGDGTGQFARSMNPIPNLGDVVAGDFNEDGHLDLAGFDAGGIKGVLGLGNGQFGQEFTMALQGSGERRSLVAADLDGDGSADLAFLHQLAATNNLVIVRSNSATPAWEAPTFYSVGGLSGYTAALFAADYNADGKIDLGYNAELSRGIIYNSGGANPCMSINDVTVTEGDTGTTMASFSVTLSAPATQPVRVNYSVTPTTATAGADLETVSGRLDIPVGQTTGTINVPIVGDLLDEFDEQFTVTLASPANAAIVRAVGVGTISDNDPEPQITINDVSAPEGNFQFLNFTVTLSAASGKPISLRYSTADGTAVGGTDYNTANDLLLNITPGTTSTGFGVLIFGDAMHEPNENFFVNLSSPVNAVLADAQGTGTINNDDPVPTLSVFASGGQEGDSGLSNVNVTIQLSNPTYLPVTLNMLTSDGTAVQGRDYVASDTPLTIPAATQSFMAQVQVVGDTVNEPNETFFVNLYNVVNATIIQTQASVTIIDDDPGTFDFEGDGKTDIGIFRPANGEWWYRRSLDSSVRVFRFGTGSDRMVPADYTGDGRTDIAVWRPSTGEWFVLRSENGSFYSVPFGADGDIPMPGDYDNDGKADLAVYRPSTSTWYISLSAGGTRIEQFGSADDIPVAADYDGDGRTDPAVFRPSNGQWWLNRSSAGVIVTEFGNAADKLVPGDYTGDGKTDVAFWRPATGEWFILRSENFSYFSTPFGTTGDLPAPGDYDGDGKHDITVFRPATGTWYLQRTTAGTLIQQFGADGDRPVPNAFVP